MRTVLGRLVWMLPLLGLTGCAAMMEQWASTNCNYDAAYVEGMKTYDLGQELDLHRYGGCPAGSKSETLKGFREGYARAQRNEAEARANRSEGPGSALSIHIGGGMHGPALAAGERANDRRYDCSVEAFGQKYADFGPTRLEASQRAERRCRANDHELLCDEVRCRENR
ncbi:hypothetical protein SAMN02745121_03220 [Nannocystis exedens]|uniref:Lipoprotein n=1 Tax=Nannocystis exedens TaxID=54 RepID=A0A1I1Y7C9_9BACT|nr:hypothetical protein [Nannocystis exedens]PCC71868.1 hypothetical protein NAEX_04947 [Nannocystis exedens]SFE15507.1 hypothetical protein SAMN02745121_03220 [Nannocystis exedens]